MKRSYFKEQQSTQAIAMKNGIFPDFRAFQHTGRGEREHRTLLCVHHITAGELGSDPAVLWPIGFYLLSHSHFPSNHVLTWSPLVLFSPTSCQACWITSVLHFNAMQLTSTVHQFHARHWVICSRKQHQAMFTEGLVCAGYQTHPGISWIITVNLWDGGCNLRSHFTNEIRGFWWLAHSIKVSEHSVGSEADQSPGSHPPPWTASRKMKE